METPELGSLLMPLTEMRPKFEAVSLDTGSVGQETMNLLKLLTMWKLLILIFFYSTVFARQIRHSNFRQGKNTPSTLRILILANFLFL